MDERRERTQVDIPPESDRPPIPGGEPSAADRARPAATGDPVVDADPTASEATVRGQPESALGSGPVRGHDALGTGERPLGGRGPDGSRPRETTGERAAPDLGEDALGGVAGAALGAVAGAAAGGPAGAIVGAIVGAVGGAAVTEAASDPGGGADAGRHSEPTRRGGPAPVLDGRPLDPQNPAGTWTAAVSDGRPIGETGGSGDERGPSADDERAAVDEEDPALPRDGDERMA